MISEIIYILISAGISAIATGFGVYVSISNRIAIIETKIDALNDRVEKHNNMVERTYILETKVQHLEDELKNDR